MGNQAHHRRDSQEPQGENDTQDLGGLLGEILGAVTEGNQPQNAPAPAPRHPVQGGDEVLGTLGAGSNAPILGQDNAPHSMPAPNAGDMPGGDLGGLLGSILGGASAGGTAQDGGDLGGLLGSILGGTATPSQTGGQTQDPMGGLLGGILGGMMGGGASNTSAMGGMGGMSGILSPLADVLSEKLGISREVAMTALTIVVPMVLNKLMSSGQQSEGDVLGNLQQSMASGQGLDFTKSEHAEMVNQLSAQTGLSHHEASQTLRSTIQVLGGQ